MMKNALLVVFPVLHEVEHNVLATRDVRGVSLPPALHEQLKTHILVCANDKELLLEMDGSVSIACVLITSSMGLHLHKSEPEAEKINA